MHEHEADHDRDRAFSGPVVPAEDQNRAAHGNITREEYCRCGAVRYTNINGLHEESSGWIEP